VPWYRSGLFALAAVLGAIFLIVALMRRFVPAVRATSDGPLKLVGRMHLAPKQSVALLRVGGRLVLVGVTPTRLTNLGLIGEPDEAFAVQAGAMGQESPGHDPAFEKALQAEAARYEQAEEPVDLCRPPDRPAAEPTGQVQETVTQLRGLLARLREIQGTGKETPR
jgi:flagellar biosynthetic protein FliO